MAVSDVNKCCSAGCATSIPCCVIHHSHRITMHLFLFLAGNGDRLDKRSTRKVTSRSANSSIFCWKGYTWRLQRSLSMFDILFNHPDFVVINKHPNVSVHKDDSDSMLLQEVGRITGDNQLYLVHRLDKMTSGLLLLARNQLAAAILSGQFAERKIEKYYLAIGSKKPKKKQGLIVGDMQRSRRASWKLVNSRENPAITQFFSLAGEPGERLFLCKPHTGKTHQIRVALKSVGSPIVGDPIYNPSSISDRGYLHAFALRFSYQSQDYSLICNPAEQESLGEKWQSAAVAQALEQWHAPWLLNWPVIA